MEKKKNILLVPVDFTEISDTAIDHAIGIAKQWNWEVKILHIINKDTKTLLNLNKVTCDAVSKKMQDKVEEIEKAYNFKVDYLVREGSIFDDIAEVSKEIGAGFVVMGTHGKQGIQYFVGSYAYKVITNNDVPFIIVQKKKYTKPYKKVVLPLDDSLESRQKIKWAIYLAKMFKAKVYVKASYLSDNIQRYKLNIILQRMLKILDENNIEYEYEMKEGSGNFAKQVIQYSKDKDADMIIIMTDENSNSFPNFIFKSAYEQVLYNEEQIPVMCVNPRDINITIVGL
jgi:nucleotide-binding universal stress UspA family protein